MKVLFSFSTQILLLSLVSSFTQAAQFQLQSSAEKYEGMPITEKLKLTDENETLTLTPVGHGLRKKKVAFIRVSVYVGEALASEPSKLDKSKNLESLVEQKAFGLRSYFLRNVESKKIVESLEEGLKNNKVSTDSPAIQQFIAEVKAAGEIKETQGLTLIATKAAAEEKIYLQAGSRPPLLIKAPFGTAKDLLSIWLGNASDDELREMQKNIFK